MSSSDETPFPTRQDILTFLRDGGEPVAVKEIAQAFGLRRPDQPALRAMLREMVETGALERDGKRGYRPGRGLPPVAVIEVIGTDADGELLARPANWPQDLPPPPIYLSPDRRSGPAPGRGDRVLARLTAADDGSFEARAIRVLGGAPKLVLGLYQKDQKGGRLQPTDRRAKSDYLVRAEDALDARPGELVLAEIKPRQSRLGLREVRIRERRGDLGDTGNLSLIAALEHDLPMVFSPEALAQAAEAGPAGHDSPGEERRDLREIPLVTIDGRDARDFDDAVWAAPLDRVEESDGSTGGWRIIVAIADVAHYVRPGSALDRDAFERGNSVYFPDRVIPMLPEALSNGWCSLVPGEDRPCLAFDMRIDPAGQLAEYKIERALMRSSARLTYEQVQAARDGRPDETTAPLLDSVITPLYGVFHALAEARDNRGTLDLDLPERQIELDSAGRVTAVRARERLDSHRLIEEMMIAANVAAARALEARGAPCVYRIHDEPDPQKLEALRDVLDGVGLKLARGQVIRPVLFRQILEQVRGEDYAPMVNDLVLRSQSQARYSVENHGHFGLALPRYAHFTSPIRRYADLLVHRALIDAYRLGPGGLAEGPGHIRGHGGPDCAPRSCPRTGRRPYLGHGTKGGRGRKGLERPLRRRLSPDPHRPGFPRADLRGHAVRPVRNPGRSRRRRLDPGEPLARRPLRPLGRRARSGGPAVGPGLPPRHKGHGPPQGGEPGHRWHAVRSPRSRGGRFARASPAGRSGGHGQTRWRRRAERKVPLAPKGRAKIRAER